MVTHSRQAAVDRQAQRDFAEQMDHSLSTADTHYHVGHKFEVTSRFRNTLSQIFDTQNEELDDADDADEGDDVEQAQETPAPVDEAPNLELTGYFDNPIKQKKNVFTSTDIQQLKTAAGKWMLNLMKNGGQVKIKELEGILKECLEGQKLLEKYTIGQLYTRSRFTIKGLYKF